MQFWSGHVISTLQANEVFVFGSNPEGRHGAGAAKAAMRFGARYGKGRGLMGQTYALVTKNLTPGFFEAASGITYGSASYRSVSPEQISANIDDLYALARQRPELRFLVTYQYQAYRNGGAKRSLNGYDGGEMWQLFTEGKDVPQNIIFHDSFAELAQADIAPAEVSTPLQGQACGPVIRAHAASSYAPRTRENARSADLTIAVAADFSTAGERLTKKSAGSNFLALPISQPAIASARALFCALRDRGFLGTGRRPTVNVAGNGIYTLSAHGIDQAAADRYLFDLFGHIHPHLPIGMIISGGQTGIDTAGIVAGHALGIPTRMTLPAGFLQRGLDGVDRSRSEADLRAEILAQARVLSPVAADQPIPAEG